MSIRVRSRESYTRFITGRDTSDVIHREDGASGWIVGVIDGELRDREEAITESAYDQLAGEIRAYNEGLPVPTGAGLSARDLDRLAIAELTSGSRSSWTADELSRIVEIVGRILER